MPPATRREVRLSASLPDPAAHEGPNYALASSRSATTLMPNLDSILENFEQFKRKHLSQNREIIKANTVLQLRLRELENRVQTLEAEKLETAVETIGLTAEVEQLRHAISSIHASWMVIGKSLALNAGLALTSPDLPYPCVSKPLPESHRVTIDQKLPTSGLVRSIAKAPEGHINSMQEESFERHDQKQRRSLLAGPRLASMSASSTNLPTAVWPSDPQLASTTHSLCAREIGSYQCTNSAASLRDQDLPPSPMGSPKLHVELQGTLPLASYKTRSPPDAVELPPGYISSQQHRLEALDEHHGPATPDRQRLRRSGRKSSRRQSGYVSQTDLDQHHTSEPDAGQYTPAPSSDPYMPSEANSETMEDVRIHRGPYHPSHSQHSSESDLTTPLVDVTNAVSSSSQHGQSGLGLHLDRHVAATETTPRKRREPAAESRFSENGLSLSSRRSVAPGLRKRKSASNEPEDPTITPARLFSAAIDATPFAPQADAELESQTGRTRRVRKSVNYALPKLNTKMRKPDPNDLIPAATPHRSNSNTPASARSMVGSTGNLSDIRKLHEAAALRQSPAERAWDRRLKGSPSYEKVERTARKDDSDTRMGDLFQLQQKSGGTVFSSMVGSPLATDGVTDTSDDESRVNGDLALGEIAELEAALGELCTSDHVRQQVDTPIVPQSSIWPPYPSADLRASPSMDSKTSRTSSMVSNGNAAKDSTVRGTPAFLPSRQRHISAEPTLAATEQVNGRAGTSGLAMGMKPKQRSGSAGASLMTARPANGSSVSGGSGDRLRTSSGTAAVKASLIRPATSNGSLGSAARSGTLSSSQRKGLHSALADQQRPGPVRQYIAVHDATKGGR